MFIEVPDELAVSIIKGFIPLNDEIPNTSETSVKYCQTA
jgi:hypothetical protein